MAEKRLRVRTKLRYHTVKDWETNNPVLLDGEPAIVTVPPTEEGVAQVLIKVGDGAHAFNDLPYIIAMAGDVPDWAKEPNKPSYTASEIDGLADFIGDTVQDTNTKYRIAPGADEGQLILQSQELGEDTWTDVYTLTIPVVTTELATGSTKVPTSGAVFDYVQDVKSGLTVSDITDLKFNSTYDKDSNKAATMKDIDQAAARVLRFKRVLPTIADLPTTGNEVGDVYLVKSNKAEYVWSEIEDGEGNVTYEWEKLGTDTDLSGYPTKDEMNDALALKQDAITETNKLSSSLVSGVATDTVDGLMAKEDKAKLDAMEDGAQENKIEKIKAGEEELPIENKTVTLATIAKTGNVNDLIQDEADVLILDGGNSLGIPVENGILVLNGGTSDQKR